MNCKKIREIFNEQADIRDGRIVMDEDMFVETICERYNEIVSQIEPPVGKRLIAELRKYYLVEIDIETGEPKADMKTLMKLWDEVNEYLEIKTIGKD